VVSVSRRKPELPSSQDIEFAPVDLRDAERSRAAFEPLTGVTHIAYTTVHEKPERVADRSGASRREAAERFEVSVATAVKWLQRWRDHNSAPQKPRGGSVSLLERVCDRDLGCDCQESRPDPAGDDC